MTSDVDGPSWSDIAVWYDALLSGGSAPHELATACLLRLLPEVRDQSVLDVGCGQGFATRAVAGAGAAEVTGIDSSPEMIELARGHEAEPTGAQISYVVDDAQTLGAFGDETVDGVTCQLALMDVPDLAAALESIQRVLRPGGWFAFVIGHPCFLTPHAGRAVGEGGRPAAVVNGYFDERFWRSTNPQGVRRAGNHHRTLGTYLNGLVAAGFALEEVEEPIASEELAAQQPIYAEVPIFFAARARRR